jgi:hypothetical protein
LYETRFKLTLFHLHSATEFHRSEFVGGDDRRVGQALVKFGNFDLFLVFLHLFDGVGIYGKLFQFALDFPFQIAGNLAGALADDGNAFVNIVGFVLPVRGRRGVEHWGRGPGPYF